MDTKDFDPLAYIESAFLDTQPKPAKLPSPASPEASDIELPSLGSYLNGSVKDGEVASPPPRSAKTERGRFRKTEMRAPRPRRTKDVDSPPATIDPSLQTVWESLPKNIEFLCSFYDDAVTANYYGGEFKETRRDLITRLLDPELSLEETSRLLGVCPATVRRYTNRGWLTHHRTAGGQRRFRLSGVVQFVQAHGRFPEV
ncbi:MAG: helix-turn-helix domain-containing protein [Fimbriimonadaceae bacterium]